MKTAADEKIFSLDTEEMKEKTVTYCGRVAYLKDFNNFLDCTVEFEDGTIVEHVNYGCFWYGNIAHPDDFWSLPKEIGEVHTVKGRTVSVVQMESKYKVTFMFDDGKVITGRSYYDLKRGYFGDLHIARGKNDSAECQVGETVVNKDGETCTITRVIAPLSPKHKPRIDVAITMKNGKVITVGDQFYSRFKKGDVTRRKTSSKIVGDFKLRLPEKSNGKDGRKYILDEIVTDNSINVMVNNVLVKNVLPEDYINGTIRLPNAFFEREKHIGETSTNSMGQELKLISWRNSSNIDVQVGDEIAHKRIYQNFRKGKIFSDEMREKMEIETAKEKETKERINIAKKLSKLGRTSVNQMGQRMALYSYRDDNFVRVVFEDTGSVVLTTWYAYTRGFVIDPARTDQIMEASERINQRTGKEEDVLSIFNTGVKPVSEKLADEVMTRTEKGIWKKDQPEYQTDGQDEAYARACEVSRKLDGCATSLKMYAISAFSPVGKILETMAMEAGNIADRLRRKEAVIGDVFGEIHVLGETLTKGAEEGSGSLYLDDAIRNTAKIVNGLLV